MSKLYEFLDLLYDQVGRGIYVWGGDGELLDDMDKPIAWIERHESNASDAKRAVSLYKKRLDKGITNVRAFDCSGLVYWALNKLGLQKSDVSSRGLYALCEDIKKSELRDGDLMFKHNGVRIVHVGVYANGQVIECKGRDYGVVISKITSSWNRFGRWKAFMNETIDPHPGAYLFRRQLKKGCKGDDVLELKKLLVAHGYTKGITLNTASSKSFGSSTKLLVMEYQRANNLKVDGVAGKQTITSLGGYFA